MVFEWLRDCYSSDPEKKVEPIAPKIFAILRTVTTKAMSIAGPTLYEAQESLLHAREEIERDPSMDEGDGSPSNAASTSGTSDYMEEGSFLMSPPRVVELEMMEFESCSARLVSTRSTSEITAD